jgi:hypothetical protein
LLLTYNDMPKKRTGTRVPDSLPVRVPGSEIPENPIPVTYAFVARSNVQPNIEAEPVSRKLQRDPRVNFVL